MSVVIREVAERINDLKKAGWVLDIGSAEGHLKPLLNKDMDYFSLDCDHKVNPSFVYDLDKPINIKEKFDIIVCLETLEHTLRPHEVIEKIISLGKDEAYFFISMPNEYNFYSRILFLFGIKRSTLKPFRLVENHAHIHQPRVKDIIEFCKEHLSIQDTECFWYSRKSEHSNSKAIYIFIDKIINFMAQVSPSLFARNVLVVGRKKDE